MKPPPTLPALARYILGTASLLVPRYQREEWAREWKAELWHVCNTFTERGMNSRREVLGFAVGSLADAWCIRYQGIQARRGYALQKASACRCAAILMGWIFAGLIVCAVLPGARQALLSACCRARSDLVAISAEGFAGTQFPTIRLATWREWQADTRGLFSEVAFYRVSAKRVRIAGSCSAHIPLAMATPNMLQLLKVGVEQFEEPGSATPTGAQLFLTRTVWQNMAGTGAGLGARNVEVAGQDVQLAGILEDDDSRLPGGAQGILLETPTMLQSLPENSRGFVVASMRHSESDHFRRGWAYLLDRSDSTENAYACIRLSYLEREPISVFLLALLLAVIALPATTPLQVGDYPRSSCSLSFTTNLRRRGLLAIKFLLVTSAVGIWSIALPYGLGAFSLSTSIYLQLATSFPALLFAYRWALHDQRNRCPDCLRRLSNPVRVGQPSCNFLSWNGTELICTVGHGLLHIPELPTSWCSTQRWLSLDSSWLCLFREPEPVIAE